MKQPLALGGVAVGAIGFGAALTSLYRGMREVMVENGGSCASGGPYEIAPGHDWGSGAWLLPVAIIGGLVLAGILATASDAWSDGEISGLGALLWFGLFGALGWNFLDLGIHPPASMSGTGGWIVCAVVFGVMALAGLGYAVMAMRGYFFPNSAAAGPVIDLPPIVRASVNVQTATAVQTEQVVVPAAGSPWVWLATVSAGSAVGVWVGVLVFNAV